MKTPAACLVALVSACAAGALLVTTHDDDQSPDRSEEPGALDRFYTQEINWVACDANECGELQVPLDYEDPAGKTVEIALERVPATGDRLGSLVFNPGGPGVSGTEFLSCAGRCFRSLTERYDVVGFDPRGVGRSSPIRCVPGSQRTEPLFSVPGYSARFWRACDQHTGDILEHAGTTEVARDLDILRSALGEDDLDYLGFSYGTQLGATYAALFPDRVGRFVLDGAVDPNRSRLEETIDETAALQRGLDDFLRRCVARACPFAETAAEGRSLVGRLLKETRRTPLSTTAGSSLDAWAAFDGIRYGLTDPARWSELETALSTAFLDRDGADLASLANAASAAWAASDESRRRNEKDARVVISCLDDPWHRSLRAIPNNYFYAIRNASHIFAPFRASALAVCDGIPFYRPSVPLTYDAVGASPIVIIGTTRDLVTPYAWAEALVDELSSGVLVTRDGDGHTAYQRGNTCIDDLVDAYLIDGTTPEDGTVC